MNNDPEPTIEQLEDKALAAQHALESMPEAAPLLADVLTFYHAKLNALEEELAELEEFREERDGIEAAMIEIKGHLEHQVGSLEGLLTELKEIKASDTEQTIGDPGPTQH